MKRLAQLSLVAATAGLAIGTVPVVAAAHGVSRDARLSMQQARQIALKAYPGGRIMKGELEPEGGGSGLRYSFDMKKGTSWHEVGVDAVTGKLLENTAEGANPKD